MVRTTGLVWVGIVNVVDAWERMFPDPSSRLALIRTGRRHNKYEIDTGLSIYSGAVACHNCPVDGDEVPGDVEGEAGRAGTCVVIITVTLVPPNRYLPFAPRAGMLVDPSEEAGTTIRKASPLPALLNCS